MAALVHGCGAAPGAGGGVSGSDTIACRYHGRDFTTAEMALMRALIAGNPQESRAGLARRLCHAIGWYGPDERIRAMMARLTMLDMHRDGLICLPEPRRAARQLKRISFGPDTEEPLAPMPEELAAVQPLRLLMITGAGARASRRWREFIARWHYLGYTPLVGAQLRYAVEDPQGRPLAMLGFSAAAWKTAPRDAHIGWDAGARERNLPLVVNNARFLILPWVRIPNLASHILALSRRQVREDWQARYNVSPVLMESFVEIPRFTGAVYRAAGWVHVGTTQGRGKYDRTHECAKPRKDIWLCPLRKDWKRVLNG